MIDPNPAPTVPAIEADNAVDVDKLGSAKLMTYIKWGNMGDNDLIVLNFLGCGEHGEVVDELNNQVTVDLSKVTPDGMPAEIENHTIVGLRNGYAFYSYRVRPFGAPDPGDESRRIFFYIGKRPRARPALPVLQIKQSHDLHLDLSVAPTQLDVDMVPYQAMSKGDIVTLHCRRYEADGQEYLPALEYPSEVTEQDLGKPFALFLPKSDLRRVDGGRIEVRYGIQYVGTSSETTLSTMQTFQLVPPLEPTLPALSIVGHTPGDPIKPSQYPDGLPLRIDAYPGMNAGDEVLCHVDSDADDAEPLILQAQVDISTIDKGFIEFLVPPEWVMTNNGNPISLLYQFGWIGAAMSATPYSALIRDRLHLPMLIVNGARPGDKPVEGEGEIDAADLAGVGVDIIIPDDASYSPDDEIAVHFEGFGTTGKFIATTPKEPGGRTFNIPAHCIPANMDKSVTVYCFVTPKGDTVPEKSALFILRVNPVPKAQYRAIQSTQAQSTNGTIYISQVPAQGERFFFDFGWVFIREGQVLDVLLVGKDTSGQDYSYSLFDKHVVTKAQADSRLLETHISAVELRKFQPGNLVARATITYEQDALTKLNDARFVLAL
ncbi:hypothetical protein [Pseudomonas sp. SDO55104_S430]